MKSPTEVLEAMSQLAPPELAESWDNVGLLVDTGRPVSRVLVTLDILPEVVQEAKERGCELIVAHHPVIFSPLKRLCPDDVAFQLVQAGVSAICMHTNLDAAEGGVNDTLATLFGMQNRCAFAGGCGRIGEIAETTVPALAERARRLLGHAVLPPLGAQDPAIQVRVADTGRPVRRLAVISGAGGSLFEEALALGADCLLTGEANHHHACDAKRLGLSLIVAGHYATEFPVVCPVAERLRELLPELEVLTTRSNRDPYDYL